MSILIRVFVFLLLAWLVVYWVRRYSFGAIDRLRIGFGLARTSLETIGQASGPRIKLEGTVVQPATKVTDPVTRTDCVAYQYKLTGVDLIRNRFDQDQFLVHGSMSSFVIEDGTGRVTVTPTGKTRLSASRYNRQTVRAYRAGAVPDSLTAELDELPQRLFENSDRLDWLEETETDEESVVETYRSMNGPDPHERVEHYTTGLTAFTRWLKCEVQYLQSDDTIRVYGPVSAVNESEASAALDEGAVLLSNRPWPILTISFIGRGVYMSLMAIAFVALYSFGVYLNFLA
ncbi:hypothetical protein ACOZ4N_00790 (plasmid) [Halorientalis pallida]|uniref:hypothetical protein n=1 Tax=Halorientalis pallida TaxID=2479928 RepID=UPI003C703E66